MAASSKVPLITQPGQPGGKTVPPSCSDTCSILDDYIPTGNRYFGALVLVAAIIPLPFFAALITLIAYLSPSSLPEVAFFQWLGSSNLVIILGLIITIVLWLLLAIPCRRFAAAEGGRPSDYESLQRDAGVLKKQLEVIICEQATNANITHLIALMPAATPTPTSGGITLRAAAAANNGAGGSTLTINAPIGTSGGDVMVVYLIVHPAGNAIAAPAGWNLVRRQDSSCSISMASYVKVAGASEPASYTWSFGTAGEASGGIASYIGVNTATPVAASHAQYNSGTSNVDNSGVTTTVANDMLVYAVGIVVPTTVNVPSGFTEQWYTASHSSTTSEMSQKLFSTIGATGTIHGTYNGGAQDSAKSATPPGQYKKAAIADIESNFDNYIKRLNCNGLPWVLYTGYVSMWDRINKVNEAMVGVLPCQTVIESANYDELSLKDSVVPESNDLLKLLGKAIDTLSSDSKGPKQPPEQNQDADLQQSLAQAMLALLEDGIDSSGLPASIGEPLYRSICRSISRIIQLYYHQQDKADKLQQYMAQAMLALLKKGTDTPGPSAANNGQVSQQSEQEARADIRKVKSALHKFTNERWDGLVRARNQLMGTAFLTAFFTYILVIIAILANVPRMNTINAMVFYFLGAIVGLFGRLSDERNADKVIDDYGLSMTRIIVTPLISGLAVLVGILFVTTSSTLVTLYQITLQNLVFAAILGFAPNILISTLQSKSEEIKGQIKGASPSDQKSGKGSSGSSKGNSNVGSG